MPIDDIHSFNIDVLPPQSFYHKWTANVGVAMNTTPVFCDVNNDGIKELFIAGNNGSSQVGRIVSVNGLNGNILWEKEWSRGYQDVQTPMAIGDINNDGILEIVHTSSLYTTARNCLTGDIVGCPNPIWMASFRHCRYR